MMRGRRVRRCARRVVSRLLDVVEIGVGIVVGVGVGVASVLRRKR